MPNRSYVFHKTLLASTIAATLSVPALAQDMALEEIVVTAQKRSESLQDTPISIAAFGTEELEMMGVYEAGQVADYTPNLEISRQPASLDNYGYSIRGIGSGETNLLAENTVGLYLDGVYIARNTGATFDIVDLERIEVLRGPQGTLYGRNTIGGAINLITVKPADEFGFQQRFTVGNRDFLRSNTTVDTGKLGDMFSAKITFNYNEKDGLVNNIVQGNKLGEQESKAGRIALRLTPTDNFTADYTYEKSERESNGALGQLVHMRQQLGGLVTGGAITQQAFEFANPDRLNNLSTAFAPNKDTYSDIEMHALTLEWNLNENMTIKSITAQREWDSGTTGTDFGSFQSDGATVLRADEFFNFTPVPAGEYVSTFRAERVSDNKQLTQEFQLIGDSFDQRLQYTVGAYYFEEESNEDNPQEFVLPMALLDGFVNPATYGLDAVLSTPIFQYGADNESLAFYGQFTWSFNDALDITAGIRYTEDKKDAYLRNSSIGGGIPTALASDEWDNTSGSLTVNYAWNDDIRTYATISQGYRSGGFAPRVDTAEDFQLGFDEETVTNYELGLKSEWMDSRLRVNAALFYTDYEDAQVNSFKAGAGGASSIVDNAGELEITGLELEMTAILTEGLRLMVNYGYTDAEYKEFITGRIDPVTTFPDPSDAADADGNEDVSDVAIVPRAPKHNGAVILSYDFQPLSFGILNARLEATYKDEMVFHPQQNLFDSTDEQTMINARLTLSEMEVLGGNLMLSAWGRNLTDEEYREWGIDFATLGGVIDSFKEKRSYGMDLVYRFGAN